MDDNEQRKMEEEDQEEERELLRFNRFIGTVVPKSLEGILQCLDVIAIYTRAGAQALMWMAFLVTALAVKFFFF